MTEANFSKMQEDEKEDLHLEAFNCRFECDSENEVNCLDMLQSQRQISHLGPVHLPIAPLQSPDLQDSLYASLISTNDQTNWENKDVNEVFRQEKNFDDGLWVRNASITGFRSSSTASFASLLRNKQASATNINSNNNKEKEKKEKDKNKTIPVDNRVYKVQFKQCHKYYVIKPSNSYLLKKLSMGEFVKVEADRGEDLGVVCAVYRYDSFVETKPTAGFRGRGTSATLEDAKFILRRATEKERHQLSTKLIEENKALMVCREKVASRNFPMEIKDAEYQFDRHKLSFYYEADRRIDFRELVSDLFALYKTRIWMQQIDASFKPNVNAAQALRNGLQHATTHLNEEVNGSNCSHIVDLGQGQPSYNTFQIDGHNDRSEDDVGDFDLSHLLIHNDATMNDNYSNAAWR